MISRVFFIYCYFLGGYGPGQHGGQCQLQARHWSYWRGWISFDNAGDSNQWSGRPESGRALGSGKSAKEVCNRFVKVNKPLTLSLPVPPCQCQWLFSRLCNSTRVCRDLIRLNGIDRLVELCREPEERNYSDAVLVSCLAVLRRLKANLNGSIGLDFNNVLTQLKAGDLVKPNIVDSFMEYSSSKHESYV